MIARSFPCDHDRLAELLADRLDRQESHELTSHLEHCVSCREHLETLAGGGEDWSTAREALAGSMLSTEAVAANGVSPRWPATDDFAWVRSLLRPGETGSLGRLGTYTIREVIGQGGMGIVLRGWDAELNRPLAIKLLAPHLASSGAARQRFLREAQAAAAVVHPNVVPIYSVTADAAVPYVVMPLITGGNLQQRLDREGPLELEECLRIALQIAEGLSAAHRQGLIHRDIKPANILLEEGGHRILISDFGLARTLDDASVTASGVIAGTPPYMSPEQARGDTAHCRSDLFSLGSVLYAMATGRPPFRGESALSILRQIGERSPTPIREINERMPGWLDALVAMLMEKDQQRRPENAVEVARLLQGCLAHLRSPSTQPPPAELQRCRTSRRSRKHRLIGAATFCGAMALVAAWLSWPSQTKPTEHHLAPLSPPSAMQLDEADSVAIEVEQHRKTRTPNALTLVPPAGQQSNPSWNAAADSESNAETTFHQEQELSSLRHEAIQGRIRWLQWQAGSLQEQIEHDLQFPSSEEVSDE